VTTGGEHREIICLDADVLIYAAAPRHPLGKRVRRLFDARDRYQLCGSAILLPELLIKAVRQGLSTETDAIISLVGRLELWPATRAVCELAVTLGAAYGLSAIDALHLASAVDCGADAFCTNNSRDFDAGAIVELDIVSPNELAV
jgi:predicted nucleic acid-binding protein